MSCSTKDKNRIDTIELSEHVADSMLKNIHIISRTNLDSAITYGHSTVAYCSSKGNQAGEAKALSRIGYIMIKKASYDSALWYFQTSQKLRMEIGDSKMIAASYVNFSSVHFALKQFDEGVASIMQAMSIYRNTDDYIGLYSCYNQLGVAYGRTGKNDSAKINFLRGLGYAQKANNRKSILSALNNIGLAYHTLERFDSAEYYFSQAILENQKDSNIVAIAGLKKSMADMYIEQGLDHKGITLLKEGYQEALDLKHTFYQQTALEALISYYEGRNVDSAFKYLNLYSYLQDEHFDSSLAKGIANAQVKFETEKVKLQNALKDQQIAKDTRIKSILYITLAVVLLVAILLVRNIQQKRKLAEKDAELQRERIDKLLRDHEMKTFEAMVDVQEEERKRIAEDLHDRLGSLLSAVRLHFNTIEEQIKSVGAPTTQYDKAYEMLDVAAQEVRAISHDMLSNVLVKFGLLPALQDLQETIESSGQINMKIFEHGMHNRLDNKIEITLYRVIQELISNILKHAKAKEITIELNMSPGNLNIIVQDDGIGFDTSKNLSMGVGLENVRKRLLTVRGEMMIDSKPNEGTSSIIDIQLEPDEHD